MIWALTLSVVTCLAMIITSLTKPEIAVASHHKLRINSYWLVPVIGALILIISNSISLPEVGRALVEDTAVNPLKILTLFLSMTFLSIFLDEVGFFRFLAVFALKKAHANKLTLFIVLYIFVAILTMFTSNDIIILTFTPFICYFSKNAKINPLPYLFASFIAANTWSMMFIIGNPTNIYLATSFNIGFIKYFQVMSLPTIMAGLTSFILLLLIFKKDLNGPLNDEIGTVHMQDRFLLSLGLFSLISCIILLTVANYINIPMYLITAFFALFLLLNATIYRFFRPQKESEIINSIKRLPWDLIPFIIAMFVIVLALDKHGFTQLISNLLGQNHTILFYGFSSFFMANFINNIPMSVLYSSILSYQTLPNILPGLYAAIIGSNLGAFLTPIGALAGMMWMGLLKSHGVKFSFINFIKYGSLISLVSLIAALGGLFIIFH